MPAEKILQPLISHRDLEYPIEFTRCKQAAEVGDPPARCSEELIVMSTSQVTRVRSENYAAKDRGGRAPRR